MDRKGGGCFAMKGAAIDVAEASSGVAVTGRVLWS